MKKILLLLLLLPFLGLAQVIPAGTYIIGASQPVPYKTLVTAIARVNSSGISGPVTFLLDENQTVTSQIVIYQFSGSSTANTLTIKPNIGKDVTINANMQFSYTGVPSVFLFNGTSNVIIDGSNSSTNTKNLTLINNDNLAYSARSIIWVASNDVTGSSNITVKNSILKFTNRNQDITLLTGVYCGNNGIVSGDNYINVQPTTATNSNIIIENNEMINVKDAININGNSDAAKSPSGWKIKGNKIGSTIDSQKPVRGMYISNALNYEVSGNTISGIRNTQSQGNDTAAIVVLGTSSGTLSGNYFNNIANTQYNNGEYYTAGVFINSTGVTNIYNNMISNVYITTGDSANEHFYKKAHGIIVRSGSIINIYYNTIVMTGTPNPIAYSACLYITGGSNINVLNNIFVNSQSNTQYAVFKNGGTISSISNNDYYVTNATGNFLNRIASVPYTALPGATDAPASWNLASGDSNSKIISPLFVSSPTDLHLQDVTANNPLKAAKPISILTDIDGEIRATGTVSPNQPYMGADEIRCTPPTITGTLNTCVNGTTNLTGSGTPNATTPWSSASTSVATVSSTGVVTGVSAGTSVITYRNSNGCSVTATVTINALPTITGTLNTCVNGTTNLTGSGTPNATNAWSSASTSVATVSSTGVVTGVSAGTSVITYRNSNGCSVTATVTINALPTITGTLNTCVNGTTNLTGSGTPNATTPWSSASTSVATVSNTGVVTGVSAGTSVITYRNSNGCSVTATVTINALPSITGTLNTCVNGTTNLTGSGTPNATTPWSSASTSVATVSNTGVVTGVSVGTSVITYRNSNGCSVTAAVTISDLTVAPTVGIITQPTCSTTTGSVVLNGLPNSWMLTRTPGNITTTGTGNSTTISGLATGTYTYTVNDLSKGLRGEYFNNTDLSGTPALTRTDATVNFDFGNGSPDPSIGTDNFSVRWSGFVQPLHSETYTFSTNSDDGIRLWVNGVQIINNWTDHGPIIDQSTPIALTAGTKYKIVLEYYERGGGAVAQLSWSSANQALQAIPQTQLDPPSSCTSTASANIVINPVPEPPTSPVVGTVTQPTYSTATGSVVLNSLPAGSWMLTRTPGNVKTAGTGASTTISGLSTGTYTYTVNNLINGLKAEYFNNTDLSGTPALTRTDATVGFDFGNGSPDPSIGADNFSARWSGFVQPLYSETYTFRTNSDDGIRLWVNGVQVINNWTDHAPTIDQSTAIALTAGTKYEIVLEYYERGGGAVAQLSWSSVNQALQIIPQTQLFSVGVGDCSSVASANVVINAQPGIPSAPIVGIRTQPNCSVLTGSVNLSGLPSTGTWTITATPATPDLTGITGTGTTTTVTGLTANTTYTFTVTVIGGCTSVSSSDVVINANPSTVVTWNGTVWSSTPTINNRVEFNANYSSGNNTIIEACSCYINSNAKIIFNTGATLKVVNEVVVNTGTGITAALIFENNASLVQVNDDAVNSGNIIYKRDTHVYRYDYTYWSSPVKGMTLNNLSPNTLFDRYFSYNNAWVTIRSGNAPMDPGHGYIIRGPQPYPTGPTATEPTARLFTGIFTGIPNNGVINGNDLAVLPNRDYLLGNPYPSAIDADKFIDANVGLLQGTLYFWTHNTAPAATTGTTTYKYVASDYASYNRTGGVGTAGIGTAGATSGSKIPSGKIGAGQGFFARSTATAVATITGSRNVLFNNSMRLATTTTYLDNSQFFKLDTGKNAVAAVTTTEKNRVWLNLTNTEGVFKQTLVGYVAGATNDYDDGFDGISYNGNQYVDFYSVNQDKNLVIQGRALPFVKKDSVALGYNTTIKGDFKISIDQVDGIFTTQNVLLEDKELKVQHDLKKEAYTFSTEKGTFNNRFVLRYVDKNAVDEVIIPAVPGEDSNTAVMVFVKEGEIRINSTLTKLDKVVVYDVTGRKLFQKNKIDANVLLIPHFVWNHQVLVVDIVLIDGTKVGKKIIN